MAKAKELKAFIEKEETVVVIKAKAGSDGRLFGSIPSKQITDAFFDQYKIKIDKRKVDLKQPIRALGFTNVEVKLHHDVSAKIRVHVVEE